MLAGAGRRLVGPLLERDAGVAQPSLDLTDVREPVDRLGVLVPAGLKVRRLPSNIPWNRPITAVAVAEDQPALARVAVE
jgi:hypothetical protein